MPYDPRDPADEPTRAVPPRQPARPREPLEPLPPRAAAVPAVPVEELLSEVRTLRTIVAGLALFTIASLILGFYALSQANEDDGTTARSGASSSEVRELDDRVDRLSRQVQSARAAARDDGDVSSLKEAVDGAAKASDVDTLKATVDELSEKVDAGGTGGGEDQQAAIDELSGRVDELAAQVEQQQTAP